MPKSEDVRRNTSCQRARNMSRYSVYRGFTLIVPAILMAVSVNSAHLGAQNFPTVVPETDRPAKGQSPRLEVKPGMGSAAIVSLSIQDSTIAYVVSTLVHRAGLKLMYDKSDAQFSKRITLRVTDISLMDAIRTAIRGTNITAKLSEDGKTVLLRTENSPQVRVTAGAIEGRVVDAQSRTPIAGATISVQGTTAVGKSSLTGENGRYVISDLPSGSWVVEAKRLGYESRKQVVVVKDSNVSTANFELAVRTARLEEVVTTVTGTQRKIELGNDIATLNADSIVRNSPIRDVSDLLEGRVPGVTVMRASGAVGTPSRIRIRGLNSLSGNNAPIVIVDGVRIETGLNGSGAAERFLANPGSGTPIPLRLDDIDPNTLESIEVLRGPSAATLYGTDAANGVIVIKTKRGAVGPRRWGIGAETGWTSVPGKYPEVYTAWGHLPYVDLPTQCAIAADMAGSCLIDSVVSFNHLNNPATTTLGTGRSTSYHTNISGGDQRLQYFVSGAYSNELGSIKLSDVEARRWARIKNGTPLPDWIRRPNGMTQTNVGTRLNARFEHGLEAGITISAMSSRHRDGGNAIGSSIQSAMDTINYLPAEEFRRRSSSTARRGTGALSATWQPVMWLSARGATGADYTMRVDDALYRADDCTINCENAQAQSTRDIANVNNRVRSSDLGLTVSLPVVSWLSSRTSVGGQYARNLLDASHAKGTGLAIGNESISNATTTSSEQAAEQTSTAGWYAEQWFGFRERMFASVGFRRDAGSAFGRNAKVPSYPKYGLSWLVSNEPFFPFKSFVNAFRLRFAYGHAAVQPTSLAALRTYQPVQGVIDGQLVTGLSMISVGNPNLRPERSTEFEGGGDLSLLSDRILFGMSVYRKRSRDALVDRQLAASIGESGRTDNIGIVENRGIELQLSGEFLRTRPMVLGGSITASANRNKLLQLGPDAFEYPCCETRMIEGYPLAGRWARPIVGYQDLNGNGVIQAGEILVGDSLVYLGSTQPKAELTYNLYARVLNGRVGLNAVFHSVQGINQARNFENYRGTVDPSANVDQAIYLAATRYGSPYGRWQTVSWLRLSNLSASYTLSPSMARWFRASGGDISIMGANLALWSKYRGKDPEVNSSIMHFGEALTDAGATPLTRNWMLRMNLNF